MPEVQQKVRVNTLDEIVAVEIKPFFKWRHSNREFSVGFLGYRGDGKSTSAAVTAIIEDMISGRPVWSNMAIKCRIKVSDELAWFYGLVAGGIVTYEAKPLDMKQFLTLSGDYKDGAIVLDEINMEYGESRRAMSNVNLFMNRIEQQLRKLNLNLYYTVINEQWLDPRIRQLTDIYVYCRDTAMFQENLARRMPAGHRIEWKIYPNSNYLTGKTVHETHRYEGPVYLNARNFWGVFDSWELQARGKTKYAVDLSKLDNTTELSISESKVVKETKMDWEWLEPIAKAMYDDGREYIPRDEIYKMPEIQASGITKKTLSQQLNELFNISATSKQIKGRLERVYIMEREPIIFGEGEP